MPDQPPVASPEPPPGARAHPLPPPIAAVAPGDAHGAAATARAALGLAVGALMRDSEPHTCDAHAARQERVADAVRAYTRVLRSGGASLATALVIVASEVCRHAASGTSADARAAMERDAARSCVEAYYSP